MIIISKNLRKYPFTRFPNLFNSVPLKSGAGALFLFPLRHRPFVLDGVLSYPTCPFSLHYHALERGSVWLFNLPSQICYLYYVMRRFFASQKDFQDKKVFIKGMDAHHIHTVLRLKKGDEILVIDELGHENLCKLITLSRESVQAKIIKTTSPKSRSFSISLFQALPKGEKMNFVIEKSTELGVDEIIPLITARTIAHPAPDKIPQKVTRWQRIAREAAKQAQRAHIPQVKELFSWEDLLQEIPLFDLVIVLWEEERKKLKEVLAKFKGKKLALIVGPEGGLSQKEVEEIQIKGGIPVSLGDLILRTETAALAALAIINYALSNKRGKGQVKE